MLVYIAHKHWRMLEGTLQVPILYVFFLQGVPLLCHLVLCLLVTPLGITYVGIHGRMLWTSSCLSMSVTILDIFWLYALSVMSI
jgi:hypothetical protein